MYWMQKKHIHRFQKAEKTAAKSPEDVTWDPGKENGLEAARAGSATRDSVCYQTCPRLTHL
jgi:hypothetical protein